MGSVINSVSRKKEKEAYDSFFKGYNWQWFCTFNLPTSSVPEAESYLKQWRISLCTEESMQVAYKGAVILYPQPHIHILMFGCNKHGKGLRDVKRYKWKRRMEKITKKGCDISDVYLRDGVIDYIIRQNILSHKYELVTPYNGNLLKR